ncbi:MAG: DUF2147 domain-containing protein [Cyclobacteriaceae bacterium]
MKYLLFLLIMSGVSFQTLAKSNPDAIIGTWLTDEKNAKIEIYKEGNKYHGKIVWLEDSPEELLDTENPDPKLRNRPLFGLKLLEGFEYEGGEWKNGEIYDPQSGKTYACYIKLNKPDQLYVRGYIGVSLLGRTSYWDKVD